MTVFAIRGSSALGHRTLKRLWAMYRKNTATHRSRSTEEYLAALKKIDYSELDPQDQITYDVIEYDLEEAIAYKDYYYYSSAFNSITGNAE